MSQVTDATGYPAVPSSEATADVAAESRWDSLIKKIANPWFAGVLLILVVMVTHASAVWVAAQRWWSDPDYQHGFLVPVVAVWMLYARREFLAGWTPRGSWWGLALIGFAAALRWASAYYYVALVDPLSIVPLLAGIVLFVGGWTALRWSAPAIGFLVFMVPLPGALAGMLSHPLQRIGTIVATYGLQTLGLPAVAQGNVIYLTEAQLGVVEACSGLRMMMLFFAVCFAMAFLFKRPLLERTVLIASAIPIALIANIARLILTGVLYELTTAEFAEWVFHDLAGWLMMPLAVLLLWIELSILERLLMEPESPKPVAIAAPRPTLTDTRAPRKERTAKRPQRRANRTRK